MKKNNKIMLHISNKEKFNFSERKKQIHIAIPTYNRPHLLLRLLKQLQTYVNELSKQFEFHIFIYNDASTQDYDKVISFLKSIDAWYFNYKVNEWNYGIKLYSNVYNRIFADVRKSKADYFIQMPDDSVLVNNFINRCIKLIDDSRSEIISILTSKRKHVKKQTIKDLIQIQNHLFLRKHGLIDGAYIAKKIFFERLNFKINTINSKRWKKNPLKGSGTCGIIRQKYTQNGGNKFYHSYYSLIIPDDQGISSLNPRIRNKIPQNHIPHLCDKDRKSINTHI
jgi:hypothetical protein